MENKTLENDYLQKEWADLEKKVRELSFSRKLYDVTIIFLLLSIFLFTFSIFSHYSFLSFLSYKAKTFIVLICAFSFFYLLFSRKKLFKNSTYDTLNTYQKLHQIYNINYKRDIDNDSKNLHIEIGRELARNEKFLDNDFGVYFIIFSIISIFLCVVISVNYVPPTKLNLTKGYNKAYLFADSTPWQDEAIKRKMVEVEKEFAKIKEIYYDSQKLTMIQTYQLKKEIDEMQNLIDSLKQENLAAKLAQEKLITQLQQQNDSLAKQNTLLLKRLDSLKTTEK